MIQTSGSQSATVLGVIISTLILSGLIVGPRVYARTILRKGLFGLDDLFIIIAWLTVLAYNICILLSVSHGYGQHKTFLSVQQYTEVVKYEVVGQLFAVLAYAPGKVSVCICLARLFPGKKLRTLLWFIGALNVIDFVGMGTIQLAQCGPAAKQWNPTILGTCINPQIVVDYVLPGAIIGAISDFTLALIPWYFIHRLYIARREKIAVGIAMSLGVFAGCFAVVKSYYTTTLSSRTDYAYDTVPLVLWSVGEQCAINVAASIPMLRPLLENFTRRDVSFHRRPEHGTIGSGRKFRNKATERSGSDDIDLCENLNQDNKVIRVEQRIQITY